MTDIEEMTSNVIEAIKNNPGIAVSQVQYKIPCRKTGLRAEQKHRDTIRLTIFYLAEIGKIDINNSRKCTLA